MKRIISGTLIGLSILGFSLFSGLKAPVVASNVGPMCWAGSCPASAGLRPTGPYACGIASPAYPGYYNAHALACTSEMKAASASTDESRN
jgi:hypothetical protein